MSQYFQVGVKRQLISLLHDQVMMLRSFRVCYNTLDNENKLIHICLCLTKYTCDWHDLLLETERAVTCV